MSRATATRFYSELRDLSILCAVEILWSNKSCSVCVCVCVFCTCVWVCVLLFSLLLFATETVVCSSHCQSQITNDTNSPRALTISTLAQLTLSSPKHAHKHTETHTHWLRTQSLTRSLTHAWKKAKGGSTTRRSETRWRRRSNPVADLKQVRCSSQSECVCECASVCLCATVCEVVKN